MYIYTKIKNMSLTQKEKKKLEQYTNAKWKQYTCLQCQEYYFSIDPSKYCSPACTQQAYLARLAKAETPSLASVKGILNTNLPDEKKLKKEISEADKKELDKIKEELTPEQKKLIEKSEKLSAQINKPKK